MRKNKILSSRSGFTLVEVLLVVFILAITALMFGAAFPTSQISRMKAVHSTYAVSLAKQKVEELKAAGYAGVLLTDSPVDTPLSEVPGGNERVNITQYATGIKKIEVTITWSGYRKVGGSTTAVTLISDHG